MMKYHLISCFSNFSLSQFLDEVKKNEPLQIDQDAGVPLVKLDEAQIIVPESPVMTVVLVIRQWKFTISTACSIVLIQKQDNCCNTIDDAGTI